MLWILLVVGLFGAFGYLVYTICGIFSDNSDWNTVRYYAVRLGIFIVIGLVGFLGIRGIDSLNYKEVVQTADWELVSLTDNSDLSASSGLFYVYISIAMDDIYSYYYRLDDGGIKRGKLYAYHTTIYERVDCTPHVVEYTTYTKNHMNKILKVILAFGYGESLQRNYEIYAPPGTILRTFSLDSK